MRFQKRPVVIEAIQFTGNNTDDLIRFTEDQFWQFADDGWGDYVAEVFDKLHDTWVVVKQGDWIIKGVKGEFYPCDSEVFYATYEEVECLSD